MKISAVIVAHNEEKNLEECLRSLNFADEIVVILDKCNDASEAIAKRFTKKIIAGSWNIEGARRNVALNAASHEWILEIDADERISPALAKEIKQAISLSQPCGFYVPIANYIGKRWIKYGWLRTLGVLRRQTLTYHGLKKYHEDKEIHPTFSGDFVTKSLQNPIIHLVDEDISDLLTRFNRYTNWKANDMIAKHEIKGGVFYLLIAFQLRFFKSFVSKKGYKERGMGFLIAILAGLYPIISYLKAKEKNENC